MRITEVLTESSKICPQCGMRGCPCKPGKCNCKPKPGYPKKIDEAANPAQQAAIAIAMKKAGKKPKSVAEGSEESIPSILYHATYKPRLKSIGLKGLGAGGKRNWEDSKRGVVYLALDPYVAESYAETSDMVPDEWLDQIVILKISTAGLDPNKFGIDSNVQDNAGDTVEYHGVIPLKNISLYKQGVAEGFYDSDPATYDLPRRILNVPELIRRGAIFVTYPHDTPGWETDAQEDWQLGLISLYNVAHGGWSVEAKKYLKPKSYKKAEQQINSSAPNLGSDKLVYDGKYNQILWSIKKLGIPDNVAFLDKDKKGVAEGTEEVNPLTNAVISFYKPVVDQIEPGAVDDYVKQAKELLNQAPDPTIRSRMLEIFKKGQKDPMIQGGVVTAIAAILTGGLLSSASRMGLSPAQTNILLQAVLNTVIPTIIARINNKSWRDTIKYTLASVGVGMTAAATLSEKRVTEVASNTIPTMGINIRSDGNIDYASLIVDGEKKYESRKTDSLRPYVGKIVGIVRTGNGPAVAIGQVTIGEPIVVDVEKFNRLRKQHLVPQGSKFDIDSDGTKYLYPMINPVRWDNEKPIKHRGIVSRKIQEQGVTEGLSIDVPNEEWLQDKIDYAKSKGRDEWGAPFFGSTTAYVRPNPQVSVVRLELLKGMRNEQNNVRKTDLEWLMATMEKTGKLPPDPHGNEYAPFVMVAYNGEAWVNEGNHRIMAAYRLGWKKMPIEIKYFDGGERVESGIMYPGKIGL